MLYAAAYLAFIFFELFLAIGFFVYTALMFYSSIMGSPYVPTITKELLELLDKAHLKKGQLFLDLGCGDGRVVREAVKHYGVKGVGIDINPLLIFWARLKTKMQKLTGVEYKVENIFQTDVSRADVIYIFLLPQFLRKLRPKLEKETKKGALIISHGFKINEWEKYNVLTIDTKRFPTYFYKIKLH